MMPGIKPGDYVETHGRALCFEELHDLIGELVILDVSTKSHEWFQVVKLEKIAERDNDETIVFSSRKKQQGNILKLNFSKGAARMWEVSNA